MNRLFWKKYIRKMFNFLILLSDILKWTLYWSSFQNILRNRKFYLNWLLNEIRFWFILVLCNWKHLYIIYLFSCGNCLSKKDLRIFEWSTRKKKVSIKNIWKILFLFIVNLSACILSETLVKDCTSYCSHRVYNLQLCWKII